MHANRPGADSLRISVSSAPSTSSHGSAIDESDNLGDVFIWGEVLCEVGIERDGNRPLIRTDVLVPRPLDSNISLDVQQVACGPRHGAVVTRQGEVYTWGEELGGRLGHGLGKDAAQPSLVETLASSSVVEMVVCAEFHTCAVTAGGELYTWGDGAHRAGLLGHGTNLSHWIPRRVLGPLWGLMVSSVACGPWHTALITSAGQLFTFGDGTFGVLGHGGREVVLSPREVESLSGLRTVSVSCGVWHTAAVVEVIAAQFGSGVSSGKLFTWGDGDKNRLGHGDKETRLMPTCVPTLIDHDFQKVACGHSLTVGLTTSGRVFTMGSSVYGQLGNPVCDGKLPCLVEDRLSGERVEEISAGAYHVAVLTSRNEVYTWGKGANGRLGHGDGDDRKTPTLVEALKDRRVKCIACGGSYTAGICLHRWVYGTDHSQCSACRQAFGFTRKRHNCYNCGLVHCHSCSSRKMMRATLSPNPGKPYRVCDSCYVKLNKTAEPGGGSGTGNRRTASNRLSSENKDRLEKSDLRLAKSVGNYNMDLSKQGRKADVVSLARAAQAVSLLQTGGPKLAMKPPSTGVPSSGASSRPVSPLSRRPSPPRSVTPVHTSAGLSLSKSIADSLKRTNELLNQEVHNLRAQVQSLVRQCEVQELEIQNSERKIQEVIALATEESAKAKVAKEVIKSLTVQMKDMAGRLSNHSGESSTQMHLLNGYDPNSMPFNGRNAGRHFQSDSADSTDLVSSSAFIGSTEPEQLVEDRTFPGRRDRPGFGSSKDEDLKVFNGVADRERDGLTAARGSESSFSQDGENGMYSGSLVVPQGNATNQVEAEWIEQYESGVYITLVVLKDGTRDLKRVRFSRRRFEQQQAEAWWKENQEKVYEKYSVWRQEEAALVPPSR